MITHRPTPEQLERLEQAGLAASHTDTAVAEARAQLARALAEDAEAKSQLSRAMANVLYGPQGGDTPSPSSGLAYDLSSPLAQQHWPSPPPTPGG
jgi:outer membrane protein TolC